MQKEEAAGKRRQPDTAFRRPENNRRTGTGGDRKTGTGGDRKAGTGGDRKTPDMPRKRFWLTPDFFGGVVALKIVDGVI